MDNMTVSLDIAEKLREAGWEHEGEYLFAKRIGHNGKVYDEPELIHKDCACWYDGECLHKREDATQAPTLTELLEALPSFCGVMKHIKSSELGYQAYKAGTNLDFTAENPANAAALLWIELKKKKLI